MTSRVWLLLSMTDVFEAVVAAISSLVLFTAKYYSIIEMYNNLFIHLFVDGHLFFFTFWLL